AGTTSAAQTVKLSNTGQASLKVTSVALGGTNFHDFAESNNCGASVAPGASCTFSVTFTPAGGGQEGATLSIHGNAAGSPQTVALPGTGEDFALSTSATSVAISAGQTASFGLDVMPQGGFNLTLSLSCTGAPSEAVCSVSPQ